MTVYPRLLEPGDLIGLVAPASPPREPSYIDRAIERIEARGFRVKPSAHLARRSGYLAGSDRERASDIMRMFLDPRIKGIFCLRGGYGSGRMLPLLDFARIAESKKIFFGFSDITAVHSAIAATSGLITFHGGLNCTFVEPRGNYAWSSVSRTLMEAGAPGSIFTKLPKRAASGCVALRKGEAAGRLIGGNLTVLSALVGTPYFPSLKGKILVIEDVGEAPYRLDRLLTQWLHAGLFHGVAAVAAGTFEGCDSKRAGGPSVLEVLRERLVPLRIPIVAGLPIGHQSYNATIPLGARARLIARAAPDLVIEERCVMR